MKKREKKLQRVSKAETQKRERQDEMVEALMGMTDRNLKAHGKPPLRRTLGEQMEIVRAVVRDAVRKSSGWKHVLKGRITHTCDLCGGHIAVAASSWRVSVAGRRTVKVCDECGSSLNRAR